MARVPLALLLAAGSAGCDDLADGVSAEDFRATCVRQCQQAAGGEGCQTDTILAACSDVCSATAFDVTASCLAAYDALVACESGQDFMCNGSVQINGIDWPVLVDRVECEDADALWRECPAAAYTL